MNAWINFAWTMDPNGDNGPSLLLSPLLQSLIRWFIVRLSFWVTLSLISISTSPHMAVLWVWIRSSDAPNQPRRLYHPHRQLPKSRNGFPEEHNLDDPSVHLNSEATSFLCPYIYFNSRFFILLLLSISTMRIVHRAGYYFLVFESHFSLCCSRSIPSGTTHISVDRDDPAIWSPLPQISLCRLWLTPLSFAYS